MSDEENENVTYKADFWKKLFEQYYNDDIIELAKEFPQKSFLRVTYDAIRQCWGGRGITSTSAVNYLKNNPDIALEDANQLLRDFKLPIEPHNDWKKGVIVKISGFEPVMSIRDLRHKHLGTYISVTGIILRKTEVKFNVLTAAYECKRCTHITKVRQVDGALIEPYECENDSCGRKGNFKLLTKESEWTNKLKIRLQETFDQITHGEQTLHILDAVLLGDVECEPLGSTVTASGILRFVQATYSGEKSSDFYPVLEINHIEAHDADKAVEITKADITEMKELAADENIVSKLVASIAPSIKGYAAIKEACLCSAVSPDNFMLPDGRELRGCSHTMLCGDPSTGKSMIMLSVKPLVPRAQYAAGKGASAKGLTVSVTRDKWSDGAWVAEAGMLVLADRALALIDEMDKYEPEEQQELNSALAIGKIPINKAGINREFYTRCPVIAGLNPKYGRFDLNESVVKQVNVPADTLSRFDLVFVMYDAPRENDRIIAEHITNLWVKASEKYAANYSNVKEVIDNWGKDEFTPQFSMERLKKWIAYAKKLKVIITPECAAAIREFFMDVRLRQANENDPIPIVFRNLDGMMRLLISQTRLRLGTKTEMRDVNRVMALCEESFKVLIDPLTGKLDIDLLSDHPKSQRDRMNKIKFALKSIGNDGEDATINKISEVSGIPVGRLEEDLKKLKTDGDVTEYKPGIYRWAS